MNMPTVLEGRTSVATICSVPAALYSPYCGHWWTLSPMCIPDVPIWILGAKRSFPSPEMCENSHKIWPSQNATQLRHILGESHTRWFGATACSASTWGLPFFFSIWHNLIELFVIFTWHADKGPGKQLGDGQLCYGNKLWINLWSSLSNQAFNVGRHSTSIRVLKPRCRPQTHTRLLQDFDIFDHVLGDFQKVFWINVIIHSH